MIRRKIWATATYCLAVAGAAQAQTGTAPKASLGLPQKEAPGYIARGVAPNAGYPKYIPRNYTAPNPPGYSSPPNLGPPSSGVVSSPVELFAVGADTPPVSGPTSASPMPVVESATPMPMNPGMVGSDGTFIEQGPTMGGQMYGSPMPIGGGPMSGMAPFLDGMGVYGDGAVPSFWVTGEYMSWKLKSVEVPALVSTARAGSPGTIDDTGTFVTYGGEEDILNDWQSGFRIRSGFWFPDGASGIDLGFFMLGGSRESTLLGSNGDQGLFRPFYNSAFGGEDAQLVAFTDPVGGPLFSGRVGTQADAMLWGFEANYRTGIGMGFGGRLDALVGYRYVNLHDRVQIQSQVTTLTQLGSAASGTRIITDDRFEAMNCFNGGQVGLVGEWMVGAMTFGLRGTVGLGVNNQRVEIAGVTNSLSPSGNSVISPGGLLAQPTNMGNFTRSRFSFLPEIGVSLGYQVTNNIRVFGGINAMYWTNVARAGEQINRNVNSTYIADPTTGARNASGAPAPTFHFRDENFFGYGYSVGLEFRW